MTAVETVWNLLRLSSAGDPANQGERTLRLGMKGVVAHEGFEVYGAFVQVGA